MTKIVLFTVLLVLVVLFMFRKRSGCGCSCGSSHDEGKNDSNKKGGCCS